MTTIRNIPNKQHTTQTVRVNLLHEQIEAINALSKESGIGFSHALIQFLTEHLPTTIAKTGTYENETNTSSY